MMLGMLFSSLRRFFGDEEISVERDTWLTIEEKEGDQNESLSYLNCPIVVRLSRVS
jgi:hypothetical protein